MQKTAMTSAVQREVLHPIYIELLLHLAQDKGVKPHKLVSPKLADSLKFRHKPATFFHLIERFMELCPDKYLPVNFGRQSDLAAAGTIGSAVMSAPTVRDAFEIICRFYPLTGMSYDINYKRTASETIVQMDMSDPEVPSSARNFLLESLVHSWAGCYKILRGEEIRIKSISFDFQPTTPSDYYREHFGAEVFINTSRNIVVFDNYLFEQANLTKNSSVHSRFVARCEAALQRYRGGVTCSQIVRRYLKSENNLTSAILASIASSMNISSRTLNRRLQAENYKFSQLLQEERLSRACELLKTSAMTTAEIAEQLGYSDASNFRRAFKKWVGFSPSEFREKSPELLNGI